MVGPPALVTPKSLPSRGSQDGWKGHFETSSRRSQSLWLRSSWSMCSAERAPSANGEPVSIFQPDWFTFHSTQRAFPCSVRSSGTSRSLELSFYWSRQCGPSYSAAAISNSYADLRPGQLLWGPPPKRDAWPWDISQAPGGGTQADHYLRNVITKSSEARSARLQAAAIANHASTHRRG